jgi:uncharacterized tellurite resistance protein B-like protein
MVHSTVADPTLTVTERRTLLAMWCQVAWADGVVYDDEREQMLSLFERIGAGAVEKAEILQWLEQGAPKDTGEGKEISDEARKLFAKEAQALARSDGEYAPVELRAIRRLAGEDVELDDADDPMY